MKRTIVILSALTLFNIIALLILGHIDNLGQNQYSVEVLGAVFHTPEQANDINLVRPPRVSVIPGTTVQNDTKYTNTSDAPVYFRAKYDIDVYNGEHRTHYLKSSVDVQLDTQNWEYKNDYWYYVKAVEPGESIDSLISAITYSEKFADYIDYGVYVPVLIECSADGKTWPNKNIDAIEYEYYGPVTWTTKVTLQ